MMAAQGYQESRLDQNVKSPVGAIGVMQVMPATGKELEVGDIRQIEPNIHAGVKYIRFMIDQLLQGRADDRARQGAVRVRVVQRRAGADAAAAPRGREARARPERLVQQRRARRRRAGSGARPSATSSNIYKYYVAYKLALQSVQERNQAKEAVKN